MLRFFPSGLILMNTVILLQQKNIMNTRITHMKTDWNITIVTPEIGD